MKRFIHQLAKPFRAFGGWFRTEESHQLSVFEEGIANVDNLLIALASAAGHLVGRVLSLIGRGLTWPFRKIAQLTMAAWHGFARGVRKLVHELGVLVRQIGSDIRHFFGATARVLTWPFRKVWHLLAAGTAALTAPIRKSFARKAKAEVLADIAMTPDHRSHKELFLLLGGAAVIVAASVVLIIGYGSPLTHGPAGHAPSGQISAVHAPSLQSILPRLNPSHWLDKLSNASPSTLALALAGAMFAAAMVWFWIRMVADVWRRSFPTHTDRTTWRLVTTFLFVPGAAVYFFKVYNHWTFRQFVSYHLLSTMVAAMAVVVATSSYGTLWYFNKQAEARVQPQAGSQVPQLVRPGITERPKYGAPLTAAPGGRTDPFAPIPGQSGPAPSPSPSASPKPTVTPAP